MAHRVALGVGGGWTETSRGCGVAAVATVGGAAVAAGAVRAGSVRAGARAVAGTGAVAGVLLLLFNLLDGLFTLAYLQLGVAEELNPLMRWAYEVSPLFFMAFKLAIVNVGVAILWAHRVLSASRLALSAGAVLYAGIVLYHLGFLTQLL